MTRFEILPPCDPGDKWWVVDWDSNGVIAVTTETYEEAEKELERLEMESGN